MGDIITIGKLEKSNRALVSAVSKAFSESGDISAEKKEHIFAVAKETGCYDKYCKNIYSKYGIAVIFPEFQSRCYSEQLVYNIVSLLLQDDYVTFACRVSAFCGITLRIDQTINYQKFNISAGWVPFRITCITCEPVAFVYDDVILKACIGGLLMNNIPVAGVDVSKHFSDMCILSPDNTVSRTVKIYHDYVSMEHSLSFLE